MPTVSATEALGYLRGPAIPVYSMEDCELARHWLDTGTTATTTVQDYRFDAGRLYTSATTTSTNTICWEGLVPDWVWQQRLPGEYTVTARASWANWNDTFSSRAQMLEIRRRQHVDHALRLADRGHEANADILVHLNDEEMADYRRRFEAADAIYKAAQALREAAKRRAENLLLSLLTEQQRSQWRREIAVNVTGASGATYRLEGDCYAGNVCVLHSNGGVVARLCVHISEALPHADNVVAQMLAIQTDEAMFLGRANVQSGELPSALRAMARVYRQEQLEEAAAA